MCKYTGLGARVLRNAENCQRVICGKSSAEHSANYPLSFFRFPQPKNSAFMRNAKLPFTQCTTDVQPMHSNVRRPVVPSFCIFVVLSPKNGSFFTISNSINFKVFPHSKSHVILLVDMIGFNLFNRCDSPTDDRRKLIMFNSCDTG